MNETKFTVEKNVLKVERTFNAPMNLVWRTWTEAELLDKWWAPAPWKSETAEMDFTEGGYRLYAMVGPEGEKHWGRTEYDGIQPISGFHGRDVFCDENGKVNPDLPVASFSNAFSETDHQTTVVMITEYASEADLETVIKMGMKEGLTMTLNQLDGLVESMKMNA